MEDILSYLNIIRKWWWVMVLLCAATVGTMLAIASLTETEYRATLTVQVSAPPPQEALLYSEFRGQALSAEIEQNRSGFSELLMEGDAARLALKTLPDIPMTAGELLEKTTIDMPDDSHLMYIQVRAADPETAALLANTFVEVGLQEYGRLRVQPTANARQFIERQLETARAELEAAEAELAQFQITNKMGTLGQAIDTQYDLMRSLRIQRDVAWAEGNTAKAQALDVIILEHEAELQNMMGLSAEYNELLDHVERARTTVTFLLDKSVEAQMKENQILEVGYIYIITPARPPQEPVSVIDNKLIVFGAVGSILTGIFLAFLLEYLEISRAFRGFQQRSEQSELVALSDSAN